jgi:hypothetical protein
MKLDPDERVILKAGGPFSALRIHIELTNYHFPFSCLNPVVYLTNKRIYVESWLPHFNFLTINFGTCADIPLSSITSIEKKGISVFSFFSLKYMADSKIKTIVLEQTGNVDLWIHKINEAKSQLRT